MVVLHGIGPQLADHRAARGDLRRLPHCPHGATNKSGVFASLLTFFAVGCPVCNKLVLLALGTTGAMKFFEPFQPILAVLSIGLLVWALLRRISQENACPVPSSL